MPEYEVRVIVKREYPVWLTIEAENEDEAQEKAADWDYIDIEEEYDPLTEGIVEIDEVRNITREKQQKVLMGGEQDVKER